MKNKSRTELVPSVTNSQDICSDDNQILFWISNKPLWEYFKPICSICDQSPHSDWIHNRAYLCDDQAKLATQQNARKLIGSPCILACLFVQCSSWQMGCFEFSIFDQPACLFLILHIRSLTSPQVQIANFLDIWPYLQDRMGCFMPDRGMLPHFAVLFSLSWVNKTGRCQQYLTLHRGSLPLKMTTCFTTLMMSGSKIYRPPLLPPPPSPDAGNYPPHHLQSINLSSIWHLHYLSGT